MIIKTDNRRGPIKQLSLILSALESPPTANAPLVPLIAPDIMATTTTKPRAGLSQVSLIFAYALPRISMRTVAC
jgi:hypothetical protein